MFSCVGDVAHMGLLDCSFEHLTHILYYEQY